MLIFAIEILLGLGTLVLGKPFLAMIWNFVTNGVPNAWQNNVATNRYYWVFKNTLKAALVVPILGSSAGLLVAHQISTDKGQEIIFLSVALSVILLLPLLFLTNVFAAIAIALFPVPPGETKNEMTRLRKGFHIYVLRGIAWEIFLAVIVIGVGVHAPRFTLALGALAAAGYFITTEAYHWQVKWVPHVMVATYLIMLLVGGVISMPRSVGATFGINLRSPFMTGVETHRFDAAEREYFAKLRAKCTKEVDAITTALRTVNIDDANALKTLTDKLEDFNKKEKECLKGKTLKDKT